MLKPSDMIRDINNFVTIVRQKNGEVRIKHDTNNQENIYKLLSGFGFRKSKIDNRIIYYRRENNELKRVHLNDIKHAFIDFLKRADYINFPDDIDHQDILEWYYSKAPIKENRLFNEYLKDSLSEQEIHSLRLQTNHRYKHKFNIDQLIAKFGELHFTKTVDSINSYSNRNPPLYYKKVGEKKYIVFNHWNYDSKDKDGFDCWLANYIVEKEIGKKRPQEIKKIKFLFQIEDLPLIEPHLNE